MDKGFSILHNILKAANIRQKVISSNIANADTPGYKAKDVRFGDLFQKERKLLTTDPKHISKSSSSDISKNYVIEQTASWGDGNNVELNIEVGKMTENQLLHNAAVTILSKKIKMFKSAIGR